MSAGRRIPDGREDRTVVFDEITQITDLLHEDSLEALMICGADPPLPRARRHYVRTVFAQFEGIAFGLKRLALLFDALTPVFTSGERLLLREEGVSLKPNGKVKYSDARLGFLPNLRFAFDCLGRSLGIATPLDAGAGGFRDLMAATKIRDRLTHPKRPTDLEVSVADHAVVTRAHRFVAKSRTTAHEAVVGRLLELTADKRKGRGVDSRRR